MAYTGQDAVKPDAKLRACPSERTRSTSGVCGCARRRTPPGSVASRSLRSSSAASATRCSRSSSVRLDISRTTGEGYALRLRFDATLSGPCMRCLAPAESALQVDAREVSQPGEGRGAELAICEHRVLDLQRLGARRAGAVAAGDAPVPGRLRRPLPGLRGGSQPPPAPSTRTSAKPIRAGGCPSCDSSRAA